jgi:hypothetical protein
MATRVRAKDLSLVVSGTAVASIVIAAATVRSEEVGRFAVMSALIFLGPGAGWILAWLHGELIGALALLVPVTVVCAVPFAGYILWPSAIWLAFASLLWIAAGYFFTVAIWI